MLFVYLLIVLIFFFYFSSNVYSLSNVADIYPNGKCFYFNNNQNTTSFYISTNCGKIFGLYNPISYTSCPSVTYSNYPAYFSCFESSANEYHLIYYFNDEDFILSGQAISTSWSISLLSQYNATDYWGYQKDHMFSDFVVGSYNI